MKVIYQQDHTHVDIGAVPAVFKPHVGPFRLTDYEKVYATDPKADIFELRGLDRGGVVVVVRPDQYVANVLPLTATAELAAFFAPSPACPETGLTMHPDRAWIRREIRGGQPPC